MAISIKDPETDRLARALADANLQHPHILRLFDSGELDGLVYSHEHESVHRYAGRAVCARLDLHP
jgi:hypothetical protein